MLETFVARVLRRPEIAPHLPLSFRFARIYRQRQWGTADAPFYSGRGSDPAASAPYVALVTTFIQRYAIRSIVDVGCGDFRIGAQIVAAHPEIAYTGVDVVPSLIRHHQRMYETERVRFLCRNAVTETLPAGDLLLVRQVLQHLSNAHIEQVIRQFSAYQEVLVSDGIPPNESPHPNDDHVDGFEVRPRGLFLENAPFLLRSTCVLTVPVHTQDGRYPEDIRTLRVDRGRG